MGYIEDLAKTSAFWRAEGVADSSGIRHWLSHNGTVLAATTNLTGADKATASTPNGAPSIRFGTNQGWFQTARVVPKNIVAVTASSSFSTMTPYTLFCGNNQGVWSTASSTPTAIITTEYTEAYVATGVTLYARTDGWASQAPASFTVEGSNDGSSWTTLHTVSGAAPATTGTTYSFSNSTAYRFYRLNVTAPVSATSVGMSRMDYVGQPVSTLVGSSAGEVWLVVRSDGGNNGSWGRMGSAGSQSHYPYSGVVYDDFGHTTRREFTPTLSITATFRILRFSLTAAGAWSAHLDGVQQASASGVTAAWPARFFIGHSGGQAFAGNIAAVVTMSDSLTTTEAESVRTQLVGQYIDSTSTVSAAAAATSSSALAAASTLTRVAAAALAATSVLAAAPTRTVPAAAAAASTSTLQATPGALAAAAAAASSTSTLAVDGTVTSLAAAAGVSTSTLAALAALETQAAAASTSTSALAAALVPPAVVDAAAASTATSVLEADATTNIPGWTADVTGRAYLGVTTTSTDLYAPPPVAQPPAGVQPVAITAYRQVIDPPTATTPVRELTHPDEETVGVPHVWVDGVDRTYSLDGEQCDLDDLLSEAGYGDRTARLTVRGMEVWNAPTGDPAFPWLRRGARVEAGVVHPTTGARKVWWSGDVVSTSGSSRGEAFTRTYDCTGPALALARAKHQPPPYMDPTDVGVVWARIMNGVASRPYAKVKPVTTGITTRKRGTVGQSEAEYLREVLATAWVGDRPWRPVKSATNPRLYELKLIDTTTVHWTCTAGAHGVDVDVTEDWTSVPNRIFGRGTLPGGHRWANTKYPWFLPYDPPDYPFTDPDAEILAGMTDADTDSGDGVSVMQARLDELGYRVDQDGVYAGDEVAVIRKFQTDRGLKVDGRIGGQTWTALWAVGFQGANLRSVRRPLASDPRVEEFLYLPNGAVAGPNPAYDPSWPVVEEDIDYGERTTLALGVKDAQQRIDRFALNTPLVGTITMTGTDFREGSRYLVDENDNLLLLGWEGRDVLFHVVDRKISRKNGSVTFTVDSAFRDALTVREILRRNSESAPDPARRPGAIGKTRGTSSPDMGTPFDGDSPAGKIPGFLTIRHDLWSVFPVPMSEYGNLARVEARTTSGPCRFAMLFFGKEILPAQIAAGPVGAPLSQDRPWADEAAQAWLTKHHFVDGFGHQGEACGYGSGQQAEGDPVNGRFLGTSSVPFYLPKTIMWVAVIAEENCRFYFNASPQADA